MTVAIVGCGPKGLYALDSLCEAARAAPSIHFDVHVFEPCPHIGAGPIYDLGQPKILLMNFPAHMINAWTKGRGPNLISWLEERGVSVVNSAYLPRAVVGRYLRWCFDEVVRTAPDNVRITIQKSRVSGLRFSSPGWSVMPHGIRADHVLITTGHQDWTRAQVTDKPHIIHSPFPVETALCLTKAPPGASVACKGFALTFIDLILALSEGRGGSFSWDGERYSYVSSGSEPALIAPFSRTGRPMRAKVEDDRFLAPRNDAYWRAQNHDLAGMMARDTEASFRRDIWPALQKIADETVKAPMGTAAAFFETRVCTSFNAMRCHAELRTGYDIALGIRSPDIGWALGEAWRRCYPSIVTWVRHRQLHAADAALFRHVAAEMERLAFGPPAQNVGKLICLERIGLVSFDYLRGGMHADVTVNATIPSAGGKELSAPLAGLVREGYVEVDKLGGLCVDARAQAMARGRVTPGLAIIGRATEGSVLGNDTLSREMHDLPEQWAKFVACPAKHDAFEVAS